MLNGKQMLDNVTINIFFTKIKKKKDKKNTFYETVNERKFKFFIYIENDERRYTECALNLNHFKYNAG